VPFHYFSDDNVLHFLGVAEAAPLDDVDGVCEAEDVVSSCAELSEATVGSDDGAEQFGECAT